MRYCKKCGAALNDEMLFCQKCGTKCVEEQPKTAYAVLEDVDINTPAPKKNKNSQGSRTVATVLAVFLIIILIIILGVKGCSTNPSGNEDQSSQSAVKSGEDYEGDVFTAFWEGASKSFGVEYSDYKFAHTSYSWIDDFTTTDGYTAHYYLIQTAFETKNAFGQKVLHPVTARCYYVPEYSNTVYTTYMTLDGEAVLFDEEKEDWLMGMGGEKAPTTNTETTAEKPKDTDKENSTTQKPTTQKPADNPTFTGSLCLDINTNTGMPASNVTSFKYTDDVCVAGKLSGVSGENNLIVRFTCPDGTTEDTMQYYIANNETINTGLNADWIGAGSGKVQVIFEKTGKVLATYNFTISEPENQVQQRPAVEENFEQLWQQQTLNADWIGEYELQQLSGESDLCFGDMVSSYSGWSNGDGRLIPGFYLQGIAAKELIFVYDMPENFSGTGKYSGINFKYESGEWFFCPKDLVSVGLLNADGSFNTTFPEQTFDPEKAKK